MRTWEVAEPVIRRTHVGLNAVAGRSAVTKAIMIDITALF